MNIYDSLYSLSNALKNSNEFQRYKSAAERINQNPTHAQMMKNFMGEQFKITSMRMFGQQPDDATIENFNHLYNSIASISDINEFLQAQGYFSKIMEDINKELSEAVKVDVDFLNILPPMGSDGESDE